MKIVGCFLEYDGKFVILLRHAHKPNGGTWGLPAGKVEADEDDISALARELREETGYSVSKSELEHLGNFKFGQEANEYTFATYRVKLTKPWNITVEKEAHANYRWVTPAECVKIPNLIPDFRELLQHVGFVK